MTQENKITKVFENQNVRINVIENIPWFCGKDVCQILGITKYRDMMQNLDDDERVYMAVDTPGGPQNMTFINESGIYECIFRSRHPEAKKFRKWVTSEVLPSIRKTGKYEDKKLSRRELLDELALAKDLLTTKNGIMDADEFLIRDCTRNILLDKAGGNNTLGIPLTKRLKDKFGINYTNKIRGKMGAVGKEVKKVYVQTHNAPPPKREQFVDGAIRDVNHYLESDYTDFIDDILKKAFC